MRRFKVSNEYKGLSIFSKEPYVYKCIRRTTKTVTLYDYLYKEEFVKRIKTTSECEYIVFDADFMGYAAMEVRA